MDPMNEGRKGGRKGPKEITLAKDALAGKIAPAQRGYRVMVALSGDEYTNLTVWAAKAGLARGAFVRGLLAAAKVL